MEIKRALAALLVIVTMFSFTACGGERTVWRYTPEYHSAEELEELYNANKDAFNNVARYVLESDEMLEAMRAANEVDLGIYGASDSQLGAFFTDEQQEEITALCDTVKPYMIMRCRKISDIVYFDFANKKDRSTTLFYLPDASDEVLDFYDRYFCVFDGDESGFYEIDDDWRILDVQHGETYKEFETEQKLDLVSHLIDVLRRLAFPF